MPDRMQADYPNVREIYYGTEIKTQKPSDPLAQRQLWSTYKHDHTVKVQFGCEGNGGITSISDTYGGGISDKELFARSGVIEHLNEGEEVMLDKGFLVLDILQGTGVKLVRPPFLKNHQFEHGERQEGRKIASHRIVIENVNARVKNFKILHPKVSTNLIPIINEIVYICACLSNFDKPLRK